MIQKNNIALLATAAAAALVATPASAEKLPGTTDGEWVSLSGTVDAVSGDDFVLDYGRNNITVEMDDYDWFNENALIRGDHVTVTGRIDNDFLQSRRIEASSVYVDSAHTRFYANPADEEDYVPIVDTTVLTDAGITVTGTVQSIGGDEMTIDAGVLDYRVDTSPLYYDPFDNTGLQHIEAGDRVSVTGQFDDSDFFDGPELDANSVVELST